MNKLLFFLLLLTFSSCQPEKIEDAKNLSLEKDFKSVNRESYKMKVPKYMESTTILNPDASLQYMNDFKSEYIIVINESKKEFDFALNKHKGDYSNQEDLINYRNTQFQYTEQQMDIKSSSKFNSLSVNGLSTQMIRFDAKLEKLNELVSYFLYYIDGGDQLYTVMGWTVASKKHIYYEKVEKMISTFNIHLNKYNES